MNESKIGDRETHGDTYEKYRHRCHVSGIKPVGFGEWLKYELTVITRRGPHMMLDARQRFQAG